MKYHPIALCLVILAASTALGEENIHTVLKGETVYSISRSFGIKSDELMQANGITDPTKLRAGQRLKIPVTTAPPPGAPRNYQVARRDTLYSIAREHGVDLDALIALNGITEGFLLREGDLLLLPGAEAPTAASPAPSAAAVKPAAGAKAPAAGGGAAPPAPAKPGEKSAGAAKQGLVRKLDASITWPVEPKELSYMTGKLTGVVITGGKAEAVKSLTQGTVVSAGPYRGFGKVAIVQDAGGYLYVYGGCGTLAVREGDKVGAGTEIGRLGIDALSDKAQLFFLVYKDSAPVDPAKAPRN